MKITIDEEQCNKYDLNISYVLLALLLKNCDNIEDVILKALDKEIIIEDPSSGELLITQRWDDVISNILLDSENDNIESRNERIEGLACELMEIFPKGKKSGTNVYWRGNKKDITLRLKKFFKLYSNYTKEQILKAAKRYVSSFDGKYDYMRVLKYFIWKAERKIGEDGKLFVEETSELANVIENEDSENINNDWTSRLV